MPEGERRCYDGSQETRSSRTLSLITRGAQVPRQRADHELLLFLIIEEIDAQQVIGMEGVEKARTLDEERSSSSTSFEVINIIVLLLVIFSGTLELVVFYNISQLNFSERIRELATLRVLGFNRSEMKKLVLRENMITTLIGLPLGLMLGVPLLDILLNYGLPNTIQFVSYISQLSWLNTVGITIFFALLINFILGVKFRSINMVEALKSVE